MSGCSKVEMSGFMDGRGPHGNGANGLESTRTGSLARVARSPTRAVSADRSGAADEANRPSSASATAWSAGARRSRGDPWSSWTAFEPQAGCPVGAEDFGAAAPTLCGFQTYAGRGTPGSGGLLREPRDAAEVDDQSGLMDPARAAREGRACVARAQSPFRRTGNAGQLTVPLVGGARTGLSAHRPDR